MHTKSKYLKSLTIHSTCQPSSPPKPTRQNHRAEVLAASAQPGRRYFPSIVKPEWNSEFCVRSCAVILPCPRYQVVKSPVKRRPIITRCPFVSQPIVTTIWSPSRVIFGLAQSSPSSPTMLSSAPTHVSVICRPVAAESVEIRHNPNLRVGSKSIGFSEGSVCPVPRAIG